MATPTEAEVRTQIGKAFLLLEEMRKFGSVNTKNVVGMFDDMVTTLEGDQVAESLAAARQLRSGYDNLFQLGRAIVDPLWLQYAKVKDYSERDPVAIIRRLRVDFAADNDDVLERNFTYGSVSAGGSNVGTGTLNRLTVDENGDNIEASTPEARSAKCIADEHSGAAREHEETFLFRGGNAGPDRFLSLEGSGAELRVSALSAGDSEQFVQNPSWGHDDASASPASISGWTETSDIANFEIVSGAANIYRDYAGEGATPKSLKITASDTLSQNLNNRRAQFNPDVPYYCQVAVNPTVGTASGGNFILTLGSQTTTQSIAGMSSGWNVIRIALDANTWFRGWNQENPTVAVQWSSASSGYLLVDDLVLAPMTLFDGLWYALVGGATPFLLDDEFTWTDSAVESIVQRWIWMLYGEYLPSVASPSETWADPT